MKQVYEAPEVEVFELSQTPYSVLAKLSLDGYIYDFEGEEVDDF